MKVSRRVWKGGQISTSLCMGIWESWIRVIGMVEGVRMASLDQYPFLASVCGVWHHVSAQGGEEGTLTH